MLDITRRLYGALGAPQVSDIRANSGMHPSSASIELNGKKHGSCHRQEYYRWYKFKSTEDIDPEMSLIGATGDGLHVMLTDMLRRYSFQMDIDVLSVEQSFADPDVLLSGRTDIFLRDRTTGKLHGCDIKTVGDYKSGMVIAEPDVTHMLQCAVYLDQYNKSAIRFNMKPTSSWIILYLARAENYKLKKYAHGSLFKYLWQFSLDIDDGYVSITNQFGTRTSYKDITVDKIYERYEKLFNSIKNKTLPDRDYEYQYSEEKIAGLYTKGELLKGQSAEVKEWMDKGAKPGKLGMDLGDFNCKYCPWMTLCYSDRPEDAPKRTEPLYSIKKDIAIVHAAKIDPIV